jgi:hypothetical protein
VAPKPQRTATATEPKRVAAKPARPKPKKPGPLILTPSF